MHDNSVVAYGDINADGTLSTRAAEILRHCMRDLQPRTDRQIAQEMKFTDMNCVRPRITELIGAGLLRESGSITCPVTRKRVRLVRPFAQQSELPL
jgi:hypothetical protein